MNSIRITSLALLISGALLMHGQAGAQARGAPLRSKSGDPDESAVAARRAAKMAELEQWLGRLRGRYRMEGHVYQVMNYALGKGQPGIADEPLEGIADCAAIGTGTGTGTGIQCVIDARWRPIHWPPTPPDMQSVPAMSEYFTLHPAVLLLGIDPDGASIHVLQVDDKSIAIAGKGTPEENVLVLKTRCGRSAWDYCEKVTRIAATPGSHDIELEISVFGNVQWKIVMHREP